MDRRLNTIRRQAELLAKAEGYLEASVLFALVELDVFRKIGTGTSGAAELAAGLGAPPERLLRLLRAGVVVGLLVTEDGARFGVAPTYAELLADDQSEVYLGNWLKFLEWLQPAFCNLAESVATGKAMMRLREETPDTVREYTMAMHNYAIFRGRELARYLDTRGCKSLLDLGCGPGTYAYHLGLANPELELTLLDVPEVLEHTRRLRDRYPLKNQVHYLGIDAAVTEIPGTYDLVLVSNVLHGLGEVASRELLRRVHANVALGGSLIVQAQFLGDERLGPRWPVLLDLIQLVRSEHGRNHTVEETRAWLEEAGFVDVAACRMSPVNTNSYVRGWRR
jgi:SAM-dependent methyltransferase